MQSAQPTVMIIDDDAIIRDILVRIIKKLGCDTIEASSGSEALALLADPDNLPSIGLLLTDIMMPHMSGIELLKAVHNLKPDLPVAIITGAATLENSIAALNAGAYAYLVKPINPEQVRDVISRGLATAKQIRAKDSLESEFLERYNEVENQLILLQQSRPLDGELFADLITGLRHELGNTATAIKLNLSVLEQKGATSVTLEEHLKDLEESTDQLVSLITRLKQYPKQHSSREAANLREVLLGLAEVNREKLAAQQIELTLNLPAEDVLVAGTNVDLTAVCAHILDNAIEATTKAGGKRIIVTLEHDEASSTVTVQDEGPGFPPVTVEELFSPAFT